MASKNADSVKKEYEKLSKKHSLPSFKEMDREFQIRSAECTDFLLCEIREAMFEKIRDLTDFLERVLSPDAELIGMYESKALPESQKLELYSVFKRMMKYRRQALAANIENSEARNVAFIKDFFKEWLLLKGKIVESVSSLEHSWEVESEGDEKLGYFG